MKRIISVLLLTVLLANTLTGLMSVSADTADSTTVQTQTKDETLFFTSFENTEPSPLLSTPDGNNYGGVEQIVEVSNTDGLAVDLSTVGGSSDFKSSEGKLCLFDGDTGTKFLTERTSAEVYFKLESPAIVTSLMIASANDESGRDPKEINFYGSNDGSTWTGITFALLTFTDRYQKQTVTFEHNDDVYSWYKLEVVRNNGSGNMTQFSELALYGESQEIPDEDPVAVGNSPLSTLVGNGPSSTWCNYASTGWTGFKALSASAKKTAKKAHARNLLYDELNIPVSDITKLSYVIFPGLKNTDYDYYYTSMHFVVDLKFTDGTYLSELGALDHNGMEYTPEGQAHGEALYTMQWNYVEVDLSTVASGKVIEQILVYFDMEDGTASAQFATYFDDITIENKNDPVYEHLSDYIDIRRGTNNTSSFSRGLTTPGVVTPNGANFYTPITDPNNKQVPYVYQLSGANNTLDSMSIMHVPSNWIGSWGTWQFMVNTSVDTSNGASGVQANAITSEHRKAAFSRDNEIAKAHYYSVTFDEGGAASGVRMEVVPTDHGMYARFTFPEDADNVNLIFDCLWGNSSIKINSDGSFTATSDHRSGGSTTLQIYGVIDTPIASSKVIGKNAIVSFAEGTTQVTMKLATSYISSKQAKHNLELEIPENETFDGVFTKAQKRWDDICNVIEIEGASYTELVNFYSCMYRLYAYPTLYSENEGTNEEPKWVYASPYGGKKTSGKMYVTNGFWDTYRTTWAAYGLFTPELDGELLDGLVQHYIDQGWVPRWIAPGGANSMVGTSSDIIFADALEKGLDFDFENAYLSMLKNASVVSQNLTNGGREETATSVFKGYVSNATSNGYSWTMEGFINDYGLYMMSEKMGKTDEAEYYYNRCLKYVDLFNKDADFFMGKNASGAWSSNASTFNPAGWWGDYTEASGWIMAFTTVYDGNGLANLYGGKDKFADKLDAFFADDYESMLKVTKGGIHEEREAREVRMGQYAHNNQPSHHIIYMYSFTNEQYKVQQLARTALKKLYVGSEIGQGYCGDEDNGEMSAWYIFSAMGFYPLSMGSGEYIIGSPLFDKVTINLENGKKITVTANNNSDENVYIQSCTVDGSPHNSLVLTHESLADGADIVFNMGSEPSKWGSSEYTEGTYMAPSSLTAGDATAQPIYDIVEGRVTYTEALTGINSRSTVGTSGIKDLKNLFDNTSESSATFDSGSSVIYGSTTPHKLSMITLTSSTSTRTPSGFRLEASNDGVNWKLLDRRSDLEFDWKQYTRPFAIPEENRGMYLYYRLTVEGKNSNVSLAEVELIGVDGTADQLTEISPDEYVSSDPVNPDGGEDPNSGEDGGKNNGSDTLVIIMAVALSAIVIGAAVLVVVLLIRKKKSKA